MFLTFASFREEFLENTWPFRFKYLRPHNKKCETFPLLPSLKEKENPEKVMSTTNQEHNDQITINPISGQQPQNETFDQEDDDNSPKDHNFNSNDEDGLNPPTRRILIFTALSVVAFVLFLASLFEPLATPTKDPIGTGATEITLWKSCSVDPATEKKSNCVDPASDNAYCSDAQNVIKATRAMIIITITSCLIAATVGVSTFLGAAAIAKRVKALSWGSAFSGLFFGILTMGLQVAFVTRKVCDSWTADSILKFEKSAGQSMYMVGAAIPLSVVGIVLMLVAQIIAAWGPVQCLDVFYEPKECCDDPANGRQQRRAM